MELNIKHNTDLTQFYTIIDGKKSTVDYQIMRDGKTMDLRSTFVPVDQRGQHIGDQLVSFVLDYAQQNSYKIIPTCPFVKLFMERHPDYKTLIATS